MIKKVMQIRKIERGFGYASINSMQKLIYNAKLSNKEIPALIKKTVNTFVMFCAIWYHLYNLKMSNTHAGVLLLVELQLFRLQLF